MNVRIKNTCFKCGYISKKHGSKKYKCHTLSCPDNFGAYVDEYNEICIPVDGNQKFNENSMIPIKIKRK